ncbi:MAG: alpha/beta hydrolase [Chitinophagaceae bacterium]|nr:alpha/beta hydrolase [Chitinophagaceae bacterium]MCW5925567.1 alpha/beta hydrolase [Chitinophagaceae bacterium]
MTHGTIVYKHSSIEYYSRKKGPEQLICFHGYGEEARSFTELSEHLQHYSVIAINLPWHGETDWKEGLNFGITDLESILHLIPGIAKRFSLAGFSMGGRVALHLYQHLPERINDLILIAPDGLKMNIWYWMATQTSGGNRLFHYFMQKPRFFFTVTGILKKLGLINAGVYNFTRQFLLLEDARKKLYTRWTTMRKIRPDISKVSTLVKKHQTPVKLIYGRYDRVIRYTTGEAFVKKAGATCKLYIIPAGHKLLQQKNIEKIAVFIETGET